ncbi:Cupin domain-containing protein [Mycena venus]|uniref:Cupin domain-containing protein n=1 Tax=Mycena venus TaxID=2733690 RepID=A0A8H7DE76_9AGAR|nr:Cupin domain-containing protein [Mycena venus]
MSLPPVRRVITGHADDGLSKFQSDSTVQTQTRPNGTGISFIYSAPALPIDNQDPKDWATEEAQGRNFAGRPDLFDVPGISCRVIDIPPGAESNIHRTQTFDFVVVMEGVVHLKLDSGEERTLHSGDIVLQKGTNHAWTNPHPTEWARLYVVVTNSLPINIGGSTASASDTREV